MSVGETSVTEEKLLIKDEAKEPTILDWIIIQEVLSPPVILGLAIILISTAFMFYHLYTGFFGQPEAHLFRSVHLTFVFMLTFLIYPLGRRSWKDKLNGWFLIDLLGIVLSIATQVYYMVDPDDFMMRIADPSTPGYRHGDCHYHSGAGNREAGDWLYHGDPFQLLHVSCPLSPTSSLGFCILLPVLTVPSSPTS